MILNIIINKKNNMNQLINLENIKNIEYINYIIDYNEEDLYNLLPSHIIENIWKPYEHIINIINNISNNITISLCYNNNIQNIFYN